MDMDRVLDHFSMSLWRNTGELTFNRFVFMGFFSLFEDEAEIWNLSFFWSASCLRWTLYLSWWSFSFSNSCFNSKSGLFIIVFNLGEHSLCCNRIENRFDDTSIRFLHSFYFFNFFLFLEKRTVFWGCHGRLTTVGALWIVVTIKALVVFITITETFEFPLALAFVMPKYMTLKASHSIWNIWADSNVVKAHG